MTSSEETDKKGRLKLSSERVEGDAPPAKRLATNDITESPAVVEANDIAESPAVVEANDIAESPAVVEGDEEEEEYETYSSEEEEGAAGRGRANSNSGVKRGSSVDEASDKVGGVSNVEVGAVENSRASSEEVEYETDDEEDEERSTVVEEGESARSDASEDSTQQEDNQGDANTKTRTKSAKKGNPAGTKGSLPEGVTYNRRMVSYVASGCFDGTKQRKQKYFAVNKYGEEEAIRLACEKRQEWLTNGLIKSHNSEHHKAAVAKGPVGKSSVGSPLPGSGNIPGGPLPEGVTYNRRMVSYVASGCFDGKRKQLYFAVSKFGEDRALQLATDSRKQWESQGLIKSKSSQKSALGKGLSWHTQSGSILANYSFKGKQNFKYFPCNHEQNGTTFTGQLASAQSWLKTERDKLGLPSTYR